MHRRSPWLATILLVLTLAATSLTPAATAVPTAPAGLSQLLPVAPTPSSSAKSTKKPAPSATKATRKPTPTPVAPPGPPRDNFIDGLLIVAGGLFGLVLVLFVAGAVLRRRPRR